MAAPNAGKRVCGNLDIEKEPLKVKHSLEFLPMGVRHRPHPVMEFLDSVTWPKDEHGDAHVHLEFFLDLGRTANGADGNNSCPNSAPASMIAVGLNVA